MILSLIMTVVITGLFAQTVDKAKDLLKANKLPEAKEEIDKVLLVEKNQKNAEAWYYKMKIYNAIAVNDPMKTQYPDAVYCARSPSIPRPAVSVRCARGGMSVRGNSSRISSLATPRAPAAPSRGADY